MRPNTNKYVIIHGGILAAPSRTLKLPTVIFQRNGVLRIAPFSPKRSPRVSS